MEVKKRRTRSYQNKVSYTLLSSIFNRMHFSASIRLYFQLILQIPKYLVGLWIRLVLVVGFGKENNKKKSTTTRRRTRTSSIYAYTHQQPPIRPLRLVLGIKHRNRKHKPIIPAAAFRFFLPIEYPAGIEYICRSKYVASCYFSSFFLFHLNVCLSVRHYTIELVLHSSMAQ